MAPRAEVNSAPRFKTLAELAPGLVWAYHFNATRSAELRTALTRDLLSNPASSCWLWLHFDLVDRRAESTLEQVLATLGQALPTPVVQAFLRPPLAPELHFTQGAVHGALPDRVIDLDGAKDETAMLSLVCTRSLLLTGRRFHLRGVYRLHVQAREGLAGATPSSLLDRLGRFTAEEIAQDLQACEQELDQYEDRVLSESRDLDRGQIIRLRHRLVRSHRELSGLVRLYDRADKEICVECERPMSSQEAPSGTLAFDWIDFAALLQHLQNLDGCVVALHDRARLLQEEVSDQLTVQTNRQLYVLSILTAVLVPPTIVVGIFGMNTGGLPLTVQPTGFAIALALCAVSSLVVLGVMFASGVISLPSLRLRRIVPSSRPRANRHAGARSEAEAAGMLTGLVNRSAEERTIE